MNTNLFDIVVPVGPNDLNVINEQIKYTKKNVIGYRNIYLVSSLSTLEIDGCITINENIFPFTMEMINQMHIGKKSTPIHGYKTRNGWFLQQLIKFYSGNVIPNILERYLVIDSDTFFLKPTTFIENNKCLYNFGDEYHKAYFVHMKKMDDGFSKAYPDKSGICHHMMFETKYVNEIINIVEKNHKNPFYITFLELVDDVILDGASEYEIYFNYMFKVHPTKVSIRKLNWINYGTLIHGHNFDYVSVHHYMRK